MAGGMMRFGIPKYRLPRDILDGEIARIAAMGVEFVLDSKVEDIPAEMEAGGFDAAFVAVGAHLAKRTTIPAREAGKILDAVSVLRGMETGEAPPQLGRRVVVYGGGNTAIDVARTAKRLGASEALIVYRRTREQMPAHDFEVEEALEEGVLINWLQTIKQIDQTTFTVEKMQIDETGWPQPTGELETIEADTLVLALGQNVDTGFLEERARRGDRQGRRGRGRRPYDDRPPRPVRRRRHGAGGAHGDGGRRTRQEGGPQHRRLAGWCTTYDPPPKHEVADFDLLNAWYYTDADQTVQPTTRPRPPRLDLRRGERRAGRIHRPVRGPPLPVLRQLL